MPRHDANWRSATKRSKPKVHNYIRDGNINTHQKTQKYMKTLMTTFGLTFLLAANNGFAESGYVSLIPNGSVLSCIACHVNADPDADGTDRNDFGLAWRNNTPARTWNSLLATQHSDADGFTNGQELGDPAGTWVPGNPNPPGPAFLPGDTASHPPVTATPPTIQSPSVSGTNFTLQVVSQAGFNYVLEATPLLVPATWTGIQTNAGGGTLTFTTPVNPVTSKLYFRIRVQ